MSSLQVGNRQPLELLYHSVVFEIDWEAEMINQENIKKVNIFEEFYGTVRR